MSTGKQSNNMPTKKPNKAKEIIDKVFRSGDTVYGLKEFEDTDIFSVLEITEDEPSRFYIKDLSGGKNRFVWDDKKQTGRPEEIVRQLWIHRLRTKYGYPSDRIRIEHSVQFGREIHDKAVDIVVFKKD